MEEKEFNIGDIVTLDRYNHIDDAETVEVVGYGEKPLTYKMDVNGVTITSTGVSIKESKFYVPCPEEDRHYKIGSSLLEIDNYWKERAKNKP